MLLKIISNFPSNFGHHGTVDRDRKDVHYDYRGKAEGCYQAAKTLPKFLTLQNSSSNLELKLESEVDYQDVNPLKEGLPKNYLEALLEVHSKNHIDGIKKISQSLKAKECNQDFGREADIWSGTYQAAETSIYACLKAVDDVVNDSTNNTRTFANVWPAGHHAEGSNNGGKDLAMGFCYFSNAAVAAFYAKSLGYKTLVIDIDNHSGNGTRRALMNHDSLAVVDFVYCSPFDEKTQSYLDGFFDSKNNIVTGVAREFPYRHTDLKHGIIPHTVYTANNILSLEFEGKIYTDRCALEPAETPDKIFKKYENEAIPWIANFNPELIIWSIGIDSAFDDPLGGLGFLPETYFEIIKKTNNKFPQAKVMGVMEGGYKPENWTKCLWPVLYGLAA